jgi:Protein of unknown function (DUF3631)
MNTDTTTDKPATVLDNIKTYIGRYVQVGADEMHVLALWVLHTWTFRGDMPTPLTTPYLYIYSAERRSGKTRLLEVLETIIRNPLRAADVTSPVLFRAIESLNPTILLDEVDAIWSGAKNEELRGVLNAGYKRGGFVYRVERFEPRQFNVFGPKALAGIDNAMLPDTVRDRCMPIHMHRQAAGTSEAFYSYDVADSSEALLSEIEAWVSKNWPRISESHRPAAIDGIGDRAWEISMPLVMLANAFGAKVTADTRKAIKRLLTAEEVLSPQAQLLSDIRDLFNGPEGAKGTLPGAYITDKLNEAGTGAGGWTGKLLASRLHPYGVKPTTVRHNNVVARGYRRKDFEPVWTAYLSDDNGAA